MARIATTTHTLLTDLGAIDFVIENGASDRKRGAVCIFPTWEMGANHWCDKREARKIWADEVRKGARRA